MRRGAEGFAQGLSVEEGLGRLSEVLLPEKGNWLPQYQLSLQLPQVPRVIFPTLQKQTAERGHVTA